MNHLTALFDREDADFDLGLDGMSAEIEKIGNSRLIAPGRVPDRDFPVSSKLPPPTVIDLTTNSECESPTPMVNASDFAKGSQKPRMCVLPPSRRITRSMSKMQQQLPAHEPTPVEFNGTAKLSAPLKPNPQPHLVQESTRRLTTDLPTTAGPSRIPGPVEMAVAFLEGELDRSQTQRRQMLAREAQILHILDKLHGSGESGTSDPSEC